VHTLHVEAVSWISARRDLLLTTFVLASLITFLRYRECHAERSAFQGAQTKYVLSLLFFLLALLSKPTAVVLPFVFLFLDVEAHRRVTLTLKRLAPFFALATLFMFINLSGQTHTNFPLNALETVLLAARSIMFTLQKFFLPFHLTILYPASTSFFTAPYIVSCILLLLLAALLWKFRTKHMVPFGAFFFLLILAPGLLSYMKSDLVTLTSDHYAYLPSVGLLIALSGIFVCHAERSAFQGAQTKHIVAACIIAISIVMSFRQSLLWQNAEALLVHALQEQPTHIAWNNLGFTYLEQGRSGDAEVAFGQALTMNPRSVDAHLNLASIAYKNGDLIKTEEHVRAAVAINPENTEVQFNLGGIHFLKEEWGAAIISYRTAIQLQPAFARAHLQLAKAYLKKGMPEEAKAAYQRAIELQPGLRGSFLELE
ncbi:MAG: tetratricopeptide repeat protein, partial [Patescibacteria group bacterium]